MQTLADIKALLAAHGLRPKHRFGQNFLHDPRKFALILDAAGIRPGDHVLEVGAGTGALTQRLLDAGARVVAVEIDRDLEPILRQQLAPFGDRVHLVIGDVLAGKHALNPQVLAAMPDTERPTPNGGQAAPAVSVGRVGVGGAAGGARHPPWALVANLPYHVASPLLANLAMDHPALTRAVVMVQKEVADRLAAHPRPGRSGGKDYGPLSVVVQAMCQTEVLATLPPGCFWPPPEVGSALVRLTRRQLPLSDDPHALAALCQRLFSRRRKQLGSILGRNTPLPPDIQPTQRPEELTVEQLVRLVRATAGPGSGS